MTLDQRKSLLHILVFSERERERERELFINEKIAQIAFLRVIDVWKCT